MQASLERLDMDYVDLLYCHRPDTSTPIEETVRAMNWVIDHGYAFYWGTSEWSDQQITEAWEVAQRLDMVGPAMEQPEYNMFARSKVSPALLINHHCWSWYVVSNSTSTCSAVEYVVLFWNSEEVMHWFCFYDRWKESTVRFTRNMESVSLRGAPLHLVF